MAGITLNQVAMEHFDAIIIGSGQGGTPLATKLAAAGWKTAVIEKQFVGGTCVNFGCTPTKTMIASAKAADYVARAQEWGVEVAGFGVDMQQVIARKTKVVENFRQGVQSQLENTVNLHLFRGEASFASPKNLRVLLEDGSTRTVSAEKIFINAGTRPQIPDITGLAQAGYFTSDTLQDLAQVPTHLLVIGGGYIGLEFGQMYRRFGSRVTILQHSGRFLSREDEEVAAALVQVLQDEGIEMVTDARALKAEKEKDEILLTVRVKDQDRVIRCSHILVAAGRVPNSAQLHLAAAGVQTNDKGQVLVNEKLETSRPGIYAIGDIKGGPEFTHISYNDHLVLYHNLVENKNDTITGRPVPYCMFTDPQLGRVGLTETAARQQGLDIQIATLPMDRVARAIETGDVRGLMKAVVDARSGRILGAAVLGPEGGEIMSLLQMAMAGGLTAGQLKEMIFAHPLYAESLNNLFMKLEAPA
jgi:pyruvate/2-oxoglutarate dehydrogenase complex dihydrolipoamide dehydrogenase (E3) component